MKQQNPGGNSYRALALCAIGLEGVVNKELRHLKLAVEQRQAGMLWFCGDLSQILAANLCLRSAERVLLELLCCEVADFGDLFAIVEEFPWEQFFAREDALLIERVRIRKGARNQVSRASHPSSRSYRESAQKSSKRKLSVPQEKSGIQSQVACQKIVHKAIYQRLSRQYGMEQLPETGLRRSIRIYVDPIPDSAAGGSSRCRIALDCSGTALHRRSYRRFSGLAPLKESIAAGLLLFSGWRRKAAFLDPFCGSGTLAIEAALFGLDIAPGWQRNFAMETFPCAPGEQFRELRRSESQKAENHLAEAGRFGLQIFASDGDARTLQGAEENARRAGLASVIQFRQQWAERLTAPAASGLLLCNPPYGERLGNRQAARQLYAGLGDLGRNEFANWALGFISNSPSFEVDFAGSADRCCRIVNGQEEEYTYFYDAPESIF